MTWGWSRILAGAPALAVLLALTGCASWDQMLPQPTGGPSASAAAEPTARPPADTTEPISGPPADITAIVDEALNAIRATPGVSDVTTKVTSRDTTEDGPGSGEVAWAASFTVQADDTGVDLRSLAASIDADARHGTVSMSSVLLVPGEGGAAESRLLFSPPGIGEIDNHDPEQMADAALALRDLPGARSVTVSQHGEPVDLEIESAALWAGLTTTVRALPGFGSGALPAVSLREPAAGGREASTLTIDPTSPDIELVPELGDLVSTRAVTSVSFDGVDTRTDSAAWRPTLRVLVATPADLEPIAGRLTQLSAAQTQVEGLPLAAFNVATTDSAETLSGYLGLPLGAAEPDDRLKGLPGAPPPAVVDPGDASTRIEQDRALVTALLDAAGDAAGIRGPAEVTTAACLNGSDELVQGSVVIPIFEIADSADDAFDAIVTGWEIDGFTRSDRAMGTDFYSVPDGSLETLSIKGTAQGIWITATAPCVRSR
jgi:hypothetical protein